MQSNFNLGNFLVYLITARFEIALTIICDLLPFCRSKKLLSLSNNLVIEN